jgi:DivIVA domain-containing protein
MPLTPADVHNVAFRKPTIGKRGFDSEEVDAFLDEVEAALVRLIEENNELRARAGYGGGGSARAGADSRLAAELDDLTTRLDLAQREKAAAERAARALEGELEQVRSRGGPVATGDGEQVLRVLMMAQRTADEHVIEARREADQLLSEARTKAEELTREAQDKARDVEREARQRHQDALSGLDARRTAAQRDIKELKQFERSYRTRLKEYLESQLRDCEAGESELVPATSRADSER